MVKVIIRCYNDGKNTDTQVLQPVGFISTSELIAQYNGKKQKLVVMLQGQCLKYALKDSVYYKQFGTNNPFKKLFEGWLSNKEKVKVSIKTCATCLREDDYNPATDLLSFVKPVPLADQYLIDQQNVCPRKLERKGKKHKCPAIVLYDAPQI